MGKIAQLHNFSCSFERLLSMFQSSVVVALVVKNVGGSESSEESCCYLQLFRLVELVFLTVGGIWESSPFLEGNRYPLSPGPLYWMFMCIAVFFFLSRESRRKTPVAVALKENERLFGDSALGMVRVHLASYASCSSCTQEGVFPQLGPSWEISKLRGSFISCPVLAFLPPWCFAGFLYLLFVYQACVPKYHPSCSPCRLGEVCLTAGRTNKCSWVISSFFL